MFKIFRIILLFSNFLKLISLNFLINKKFENFYNRSKIYLKKYILKNRYNIFQFFSISFFYRFLFLFFFKNILLFCIDVLIYIKFVYLRIIYIIIESFIL